MGRRPKAFLVLVALAFATPLPARADVTACIAAFEDGQKLVAGGKLLIARDRFAACADAACPSAVRVDCVQRREEVERAIPTVSLVVRDANGAEVDARISVDGVPFAATPGRATAVDPGKHVALVERPGQPLREQSFTANEGEKSRVIVLLAGASDAPGGGRVDPKARGDTEKAKRENDATPPAAERPTNLGPWIVIGVGGAFVVGGIVFLTLGIISANDATRVHDQLVALGPSPNTLEADAYSASYDSKRTAANIDLIGAIVCGVVGAGGIVGGLVWRSSENRSSALHVVPSLGPSHAGGTVSVSF